MNATGAKTVVVLCGGADHAHDFPSTATALVELVESAGHHAELVTHPDDAARAVATGAPDALVVNALWWRMLGDAYAPWRARWAYRTPPATRDALETFVAGGGGLLANHTAPICFDDWPQWGDIVGGSWRWGVSSHPPTGPVTARVVGAHPIAAGLPDSFELVDEVYGDLDVRPTVEVFAVAKRSPDDADQPVAWTHRYRDGKVVFDGFGHDADSIRDPHNAALLAAGLSYVLGES